MPRIHVLSGPDIGASFEVHEGSTFGRAQECAVLLRDPSISRMHARLEREDETWVVLDTNSRNGVRRAGERVARAVLADNEEFVLGEVHLRFRLESAPAAQAARTSGDHDLGASGARASAQSARPAPPADDDALEIELEGDWDATVAPASRVAAPRPIEAAEATRSVMNTTAQATSAARAQAVAKLAAAGIGGRGGRAAGERGILQYQRVEQSSSRMGVDLMQLPAWIRFAIVVGALVLLAALAWLAFRGTTMVRGTLQDDASADEVVPG